MNPTNTPNSPRLSGGWEAPGGRGGKCTGLFGVPPIGMGAGGGCDGQVLVSYDLLGPVEPMRPKFVKRYEELFARGVDATRAFVSEVRSGAFPAVEHTFGAGKPAAQPAEPRAPSATEPDPSLPVTEAHAYGPTN